MKPTTKAWLTEKDIWNARLLAPCKSQEDVDRYIERHLLFLHPKWCREAPNKPGQKQYRKNLFEPGAIARWRASAVFLDHARETGLEERLIERKRDGKPRQTVKVKKPPRQPDGVWLTTREVYEQRLMGEGRSLSAVRGHIVHHRLADDPTLSRKGYGREREFHISLFSPEAMAKRAERSGWQPPARQGTGEWLTIKEIHKARLLGERKTLLAVKLYIQRYRLSDHPTFCRRIDGSGNQLEYHCRLFTAEAIEKRKALRGWQERDEPVREGYGGRLGSVADLGNAWLTAEDIYEAKLLGEKKTLLAVRKYILHYRLSDHPKYCRRLEGDGNRLEYHVRLFTPELIAKRRKYKAGYEDHQPRGFNLLSTAEGGRLILEAAKYAVGRDYPSKENAAAIRKRCIAIFGMMVMKDNDPAERVRIPPMRVFLYWLGKAQWELREERRMREQNAAHTARMKQIAEDRRHIVEARRQEGRPS